MNIKNKDTLSSMINENAGFFQIKKKKQNLIKIELNKTLNEEESLFLNSTADNSHRFNKVCLDIKFNESIDFINKLINKLHQKINHNLELMK